MNWKERLSELEKNKDWDSAIVLMEAVVRENDNDLDAYLCICYLLMNLLVEEDYNDAMHNYYAGLLKKFYIESYAKFSDNPRYLFYVGKIAYMSEWYFDIEQEEAQGMIRRALELDPDNILYQWADSTNRTRTISCAKQALFEPRVREELKSLGALGEYLWGMLSYQAKEEAQQVKQA